MKAKLTLWFSTAKALNAFLANFVEAEAGLKVEIYSANSYKTVTIPDVSAYTLEGPQLRFSAGCKGFFLDATAVIRQEIAFYEVEE